MSRTRPRVIAPSMIRERVTAFTKKEKSKTKNQVCNDCTSDRHARDQIATLDPRPFSCKPSDRHPGRPGQRRAGPRNPEPNRRCGRVRAADHKSERPMKSLAERARKHGLLPRVVYMRVARGETIEKALRRPVQPRDGSKRAKAAYAVRERRRLRANASHWASRQVPWNERRVEPPLR